MVVAELFRAVLPGVEVGVEDDFFLLGGDSMGVIALVALAEARGMRIATEAVYRERTARGVAETLARAEAEGRPVDFLWSEVERVRQGL